jgi:hypothetical protein
MQDSLAAAVVTQMSRDDLVESSLRLLVDVGGEPDGAALRGWRVHQFADRREDCGDGFIVRGELFADAGFQETTTKRGLDSGPSPATSAGMSRAKCH